MHDSYSNILLIFGSGRQAGKTAFARRVIANTGNVTAVKISHHFHTPTPGLVKLSEGEGWVINREEDATSQKDSSLFLQSGASASFYIQAEKSKIQEVFDQLKNFLPETEPILIESAGLSEILTPGLSVFISPENEESEKNRAKAENTDLKVFSDGKQFHPAPEIVIFDKVWKIKN